MKKHPTTLPFLRTSLFILMLAATAVSHSEELPLSGPAYLFADQAYKDFARGNYAAAAAGARKAIQLRPDVPRLHDLLRKANASTANRNASKQAGVDQKASASASKAAYAAANAGYIAYEQRDYAAAAVSAKRAVDLVPDNRAYRLLLINSLAADGKLEAAQNAIADAIARFGQVPDLSAVQRSVNAQLAFPASDASYRAMERGDFEKAVNEAQKAVGYLPSAPALRIALINTLVASRRMAEAEQAASDMIASGKPSSEALLLRGAIRQHLGAALAAQTDFDHALSLSVPQSEAQHAIRIVAADAALVSRNAQRALQLLAQLNDGSSPDAAVRRELAALLEQPGASQARTDWVLSYPSVSCNSAQDFSMACTIVPGAAPADPGFVAADDAYRAFGARDYARAGERAAEAARLSPMNRDYRRAHVQALVFQSRLPEAEQVASAALTDLGKVGALLLARAEIRKLRDNQAAANDDYAAVLTLADNTPRTEIAALLGLGRYKEARVRLAEIKRTEPGGPDLDLAYLALQTGDARTALEVFSEADTSGRLTDVARYDAAFAASRMKRNEQAIGYFKQTIDAATTGQLMLDPQQIYDARRAVADLSRKWGARASLSRRGIAAAGIGVPQGGTDDGIEAGAEVYWRPYGFQNGKLFEIYGRFNETVAGGSSIRTGSATAQAAIGARVKPFSETNVVFAMERLVALGSESTDSWLARAGFSTDSGIDFKVGKSDWFTSHFYGEAGHYFRKSQNYGTLEGQVGRTYRMGGAESTVAVFPHLVLGADYDSGLVNHKKQAWGSGIGTNLRYWFRQDSYNAPRSHTDISVQYRWKIAGDKRAEGLFVRIGVSY